MLRYAAQLPPGFPCCAKAPEAVTSPVRVGTGVRPPLNLDFMKPRRLEEEMVGPFLRCLGGHAGPFLLQFPPFPRSFQMAPEDFARRLDALLVGLTREARYAVELRDPSLLCPAYGDVLATRGCAHVFNYAAGMPYPAAQARVVPPDAAPFLVIRLLLRPGSRYAERREAFAPFDRIADPDPEMRSEVAGLVRDACRVGRPSFVIVNNKAEGCAPLTVKALAELVACRLGP